MSFVSSVLRRRNVASFGNENLRQGLPLAVAVVVAYAASAALGLPERFWAVMSTLIVMRAEPGATIDASWARVRGTLIGAACGLLGVALQHLGGDALATTLTIVAALAFASAYAPWLRSAAVAALIILAAGDLAGHSALEAAVLRVVQILIGVGAGTAVAIAASRYRAVARFDEACAALLGRLALQTGSLAKAHRPDATAAEAAAAGTRGALVRLTVLAAGADRALRPSWRAQKSAARPYRRKAAVIGRIVQDTAVLHRLLRECTAESDDRLSQQVVAAVNAGLASAADAIATGGQVDLRTLDQLAEATVTQGTGATNGCAGAVLLGAPLYLLLADLRLLVQAPEVRGRRRVARER